MVMRYLLRLLNWIANTFPILNKISLMRPISLILFIVAWATGQVSGWLAWAILFLIMDLSFDINRR